MSASTCPASYYSSYYKGVGSATALSFLPWIGWLFSKDRSHVLEEPFGLNRIWVPTHGHDGSRVRSRSAWRPTSRSCRRTAPDADGQGPLRLRPAGHPGRRGARPARRPARRLHGGPAPVRASRLGRRLLRGQVPATARSCCAATASCASRRCWTSWPWTPARRAAVRRRSPAQDRAEAASRTSCPPRTLADVIDLTTPPDPFAIPAGEWAKGFNEYAERNGLVHEEPRAFHRAFPSLPSPGQAVAVMRGNLPGTSVPGRVVYYAEHPLGEKQNVRGRDRLQDGPRGHAARGRRGRRTTGWCSRRATGSAWRLEQAELGLEVGVRGRLPAASGRPGRLTRALRLTVCRSSS